LWSYAAICKAEHISLIIPKEVNIFKRIGDIMKFNPFRPGSIVTPTMFAGRGDEIICIEKYLFQAKNENPQHFMVLGERGIGKSSLMLVADYLAKGEVAALSDKLKFLVVNLELQQGISSSDLIKLLAKKFQSELNLRDELKAKAINVWNFLNKWEVMGVKYNATENQFDPIISSDELVTQMIEVVKKSAGELDGIAIFIDEADKAGSTANLGQILKHLSERITRSGCSKIIFGLAGLPELITTLKDSHESSTRIFHVLNLEPLSKEERIYVIDRALDEANSKSSSKITIEEEAKELIADLSEGYPHFIQQFGYSAFEADKDNNIDARDVLSGTFNENGALDQLGHKYFQEHFFEKVGTDDYRKVLIFMADFQDQWVARSLIIDGLKNILNSSTIDNALRALKSKNIILQSSANRGEYKLPTKSFAAWIKVKTTNAN
jgi:AAA+ ATPase superfamily predicted ATPase